MTVILQPITRDNWQVCIRLKPTADQTHFVAPNLYSLAESKYDPSMVPLGIYAGEEQIIAELRQRPDCQSITLGFEPENHGTEQLYERLGCRRTGEVLDGEIISRLDF